MMQKAHDASKNTHWQDLPSSESPIIAEELNRIEHTIDVIDDRVIVFDTNKANQTDMLQAVKTISYTKSTGTFRITFFNQTYVDIDTDLEKLAINFDYDDDPTSEHYQQIILTLVDGTVKYIDLSALITQYEFTDSATIDFTVGSDGKISAVVIDGSITESKLQPNYLADIRVETAKSQQYMTNAQTAQNEAETAQGLAEDAQDAAEIAQGLAETAQDAAEDARDRASTSASNASMSATEASGYADDASANATLAETYANNASTSASNASTSENNASTYATSASNSATSASTSATNAENSAEDSEAWAVGQRNGVDVPSTDETYENNAKYYAEQAHSIVGDKVDSFNGRNGNVLPTDGDYSIGQISPSTGATEGQIPIVVNEGTQAEPSLKFRMQDIPHGEVSASDVKMSSGENVEDAYKNITILIPPNITDYASYKNAGGNRGEDITEYWKDGSLADRIDGVNGFKPFEGMYLWDYIDLDSNITAPSSGGGSTTGTKRIHIGEFNGLNNYQLNKRTDSVNFFNHLRMVTGTHFGMSKMNDTNTTVGGYVGSKMHTDIIGDISTSGTLAKQLYDQLGSLLVPTTELLTNSINASGYNRFGTNSGCSNSWVWTDVYARLLSEIESNGSIVWSSSGFDTGNALHQLPAFKNNKAVAYPQGIYYWIKDISNSERFCDSRSYNGIAASNYASDVNYVRLLITIGRKPS